jgi:hypothetical protein
MMTTLEYPGSITPEYSLAMLLSTTDESKSHIVRRLNKSGELLISKLRDPEVFDDPPRERQPVTNLSPNCHRFVTEVGYGQIHDCATFLARYTSLLKEHDVQRLCLLEAKDLLKSGNPDDTRLARSYVEKGLMLHECRGQKLADTSKFFKSLQQKSEEWKVFAGQVQSCIQSLQKKNSEEAPRPESDPDRHKAQTGLVDTFSVLEIESGTRSQRHGKNYNLDTRRQTGSQYRDFTSTQGPSYTILTQQNRSDHKRRTSFSQQPASEVRATESKDSRHAANRPTDPLPPEDILSNPSAYTLPWPPDHQGKDFPKLGNDITKIDQFNKKLDPSFRRIHFKKAGEYFVPGRVFSTLWHTEKTGDNVVDPQWTNLVMGVKIYSSIRRFIVVKSGHGYAWCVGISTYSGHGAKKKGFNQSDIDALAIAYSSGERPRSLNNEPPLQKKPIEVSTLKSDPSLDIASRINFSQPQTIQ